MKIAYLLPRLDNKSSITLFQDLIPQLKLLNSNIKIDIYYFDKEIELNFAVNTYRLNFLDSFPVNDYDIVHSSGLRPNVYIYLNKRKFNSKTKFVTTIHSFIYEDFKNQFNSFLAFFYSKIWFSVLNSQNVVVVLTNIAKDYYASMIKSRIVVINNGRKIIQNDSILDTDVELMERIKNEFPYVIGTHAVVSKIKGLDTVIKGLENLTEFCFVIIGDGSEVENLKVLAKELSVQDRVFFLGFKKNISSFFKYYNVYAMPSRSEGLPIALIEAVSFKTPCITSDIPTFKELFKEEEVVSFKLDNVEDFCQQILKFKQIDFAESRVEKAYLKYIDKYSDGVMAKNYYNLYLNLLQ
jgi:glycosyltransferase involved in cell wall biosynthesis